MKKKEKSGLKNEMVHTPASKTTFSLKTFFTDWKLLLFIAAIVFALYLSFYQLGSAPLDNWDEAFHAEMGKEMIQTGNYIIPSWNYHIFLDKPPLYMWLGIIWTKLFGLNEFSWRLTSAISGFVAIIWVTWYVYKEYGFFPSVFTYLSLLLNDLFIWRTRSGNFDTFTALLTLSVFFLTLTSKKYRYPLLGLVFTALYLTRGSFVLFPGIIFAVHEVIFRWRSMIKNISWYGLTLGVLILISGIWLYLGYQQDGKEFLDFFLFKSDHDVSATAKQFFSWEYVQYGYYALQRRYFFVLLVGLAFLLRYIYKPRNFLLFFFSTILLVLLSFSPKKNNWYLVPLFPFWSMVVGYAIYEIIRLLPFKKVVIVLLLLAGCYMSYRTYNENIIPILNTSSSKGETASAKYIKDHTKPGDTIARLDHLYPAYIYYSDRKVRIAPSGDTLTNDYFTSTKDLIQMVKNHEIYWLAGETRDVNYFSSLIPDVPHKKIEMNPAEYVIQITK